MNTTEKTIETLFNKVEDYSKTSIELLKLNAIDKTADLVSTLLTQMILFVVGLVFLLMISIGVAFWLGTFFDSDSIGFFIVSGFYLVVTLVYFFVRKKMKAPIRELILSNLIEQRR
jgi:uncharacterized BrkB/YihY/UPF0761 family membrane protein